MNHGVRKFWILLLLTFIELLEFSFFPWTALEIGCWNVTNFSSAVPRISTVSMVWTYFFHQGRKLVDICRFLWNIPDILLINMVFCWWFVGSTGCTPTNLLFG